MLGKLLGGRYEIIRILGEGGFGQTYLAKDIQRPGEPTCVVKHLKPASEDSSFLPVARRLFKTEAEILEKLGRHDQIPQLLAYFEENKQFYLIQEWVPGQTLREELKQGKFDEPLAIALLQDVLGILTFVHDQGVIHRDIKPSNLIRRQTDGKFVLIDFGSVKQIQCNPQSPHEHTAMTVGVGTHGYMPSEQMVGRPRLNSDLYALGIVVIEALTGVKPHNLEVDPETSELLWQQEAAVSPGLAQILEQMVQSHFRDRAESAHEVLQALHQLNKPDLPTRPLSFPAPKAKQVLNHRLFKSFLQVGKVLGAATLISTVLVGVVRQQGVLEGPELALLDRQMQQKQPEAVDDRFLLVTTPPNLAGITPQQFSQILTQLQQAQVKAIALDLPPETLNQWASDPALGDRLKAPNLVISVPFNAPVATFAQLPKQQMAFKTVVLDRDGIARRTLLLANHPQGVVQSLAVKIAIAYLSNRSEFVIIEGVTDPNAWTRGEYIQLGRGFFRPLESHSGGYQSPEISGYQVLLNYRKTEPNGASIAGIVPQMSVTELLNGQISPETLKGRVIVIGDLSPQSPSVKTPFRSQQKPVEVPEILLQIQAASQVLSSASDRRPVWQFWPENREILWIAVWALAGGIAGAYIRRGWVMVGAIGGFGFCFVGLTTGFGQQLFWIPVVAPALSFGVSLVFVAGYQSLQRRHQSVALPTNPTAATLILDEGAPASGTSSGKVSSGLPSRGSQVASRPPIPPRNASPLEETEITPPD